MTMEMPSANTGKAISLTADGEAVSTTKSGDRAIIPWTSRHALQPNSEARASAWLNVLEYVPHNSYSGSRPFFHA